MNQLIANFLGWVASALFVATAAVFWGIAALLVWVSGNRTLAERN